MPLDVDRYLNQHVRKKECTRATTKSFFQQQLQRREKGSRTLAVKIVFYCDNLPNLPKERKRLESQSCHLEKILAASLICKVASKTVDGKTTFISYFESLVGCERKTFRRKPTFAYRPFRFFIVLLTTFPPLSHLLIVIIVSFVRVNYCICIICSNFYIVFVEGIKTDATSLWPCIK